MNSKNKGYMACAGPHPPCVEDYTKQTNKKKNAVQAVFLPSGLEPATPDKNSLIRT